MSGKPVGWMRGSLLEGSKSAVMKVRRQPAGMVNPPNSRSAEADVDAALLIIVFLLVLVIGVKSQSACGRDTVRNRAARSRRWSGMHTAAARRAASVDGEKVVGRMMSRPARRSLPSLALFQSGFG